MAICWDKTTLLLEYTRAVKEYSDAIAVLHELHSTISKEEYECLYRVADTTRITAEEERVAMVQHILNHEC